jgi:hypothetical protein
MVLESVFSSLLSIGGIISLAINVIITAVAIMLSDKLIAHEISPKKSVIMAVIAYLIVPLVISIIASFAPAISLFGFVLPLVAWIVLGEILLSGDFKLKAIIAVIAYALNLILLMYVTPLIFMVLPF